MKPIGWIWLFISLGHAYLMKDVHSNVLRSNLATRAASVAQNLFADVGIVGGGPAGTTLACLLQDKYKLNTVMVDPVGLSKNTWYPNYGEWRDEWHHVADSLEIPELKQCVTNEWDATDCFFGESGGVSLTLSRGYVRVDRGKMQSLLRKRFEAAGGQVIPAKLNAKLIAPNMFDGSVVHDVSGTSLSLSDGSTLRCAVMVDATGLESKLTARTHAQTPFPINYQIAYGFIATVDSLSSYAADKMTLFDFR